VYPLLLGVLCAFVNWRMIRLADNQVRINVEDDHGYISSILRTLVSDNSASALVFLLLAQLGVPEIWLYNNVPAFGPQSTPLWLGVGQVM
jgi:hypothetical protein